MDLGYSVSLSLPPDPAKNNKNYNVNLVFNFTRVANAMNVYH
jgi:hypothetical protein